MANKTNDEHDFMPDNSTLSAQIQSAYTSLSATEKRIADYVLNVPEQIMYNSVTQVAEELEIAQSTVTKFCRTIGLRGFQELKIRLAQDTERTNPANEDQEEMSLSKQMAQSAANSIVDAGGHIDRDAVDQAVSKLASARRIIILGVGESGPMAQLLKIKLMGIGLTADAQIDIHLQSMLAAHLDERDVAIGISQQGSTKDIVASMRSARANGATTICITGQGKTPITEVSDIRLVCASRLSSITGIGSFKSKASILYVIELLVVMLTLLLSEQQAESKKKLLWKTTDSILDKLY
ncbi:MurR/RpiR family transcriptional regulator [Paenibacillus spongiae]|uniref:MurR/RpiR family transcriptional regulator n=1 Tax=Paenibacillus spongiae TaxID=2909671 RepID=A0ABY5S6K8_9BACL|nr:MurR/RpiR family transcriptional regulator [Paenibacillus spongiae]UVI29537.1 MurR/RpiR family transcriptional regulator [Paenibacillus spongiae]